MGKKKEKNANKSIENQNTIDFTTAQTEISAPISSARSSQPDVVSTGFLGQNTVLLPDYGIKWFGALEHLAVFNRHISKAVENVVSLSNTDMRIYFSDSVPAAYQAKMKQFINDTSDKLYEFSGGESALKQDMFVQAALFGAVSFESIPNEKLNDLKKVVLVSPKYIRFKYDDVNDKYYNVQEIRYTTKNLKTEGGYIVLNPVTYKYIGIKRVGDSPYGVPPFLSAIEDVMTQYDMIGNFKMMMKKIGMLGFLSVLVNPPKQNPNEAEQDYYNRLAAHLRNNIQPQVEKQMATGTAIGYKGSHEFNLAGNTVNGATAKDLMQIINTFIYEGLKQDPVLHGENFSVTETFANIVLRIASMQAASFQDIVAKAFEEIYMLKLTLAGFKVPSIKVEFDLPDIKDKYKDEQTEQIRIANVNLKVDRGYISQEVAAQELGYEQSYLSEQEVQKNNANMGKAIEVFEKKLNKEAKEFQYEVPVTCLPIDMNYTKSDDKVVKYQNKYSKQIEKLYSESVNKSVDNLNNYLKGLKKPITQEEMNQYCLFFLYKDWNKYFITPSKDITKTNVNDSYKYFRTDKSIFIKKNKEKTSNSFVDIPKATFSVDDLRSIEFFNKLDNFYLGKFITDEDTKQRILDWINDYYLVNMGAIGNNQQAIDDFTKEFGDIVTAENFKIRRIIDTTINKVRAFSNINYIQQAEVEEFEIVEINDRLTCSWCSSMNGRVFSVTDAKSIMNDVTSSDPADVPNITPFATNVKIDEFRTKSNQELVSDGICLPAYHPHCRGRVVAYI